MTPKEFQFLLGLIELTSEAMYKMGYEDAKAGRAPKADGFKPSKANTLLIKTNLEKLTKRR